MATKATKARIGNDGYEVTPAAWNKVRGALASEVRRIGFSSEDRELSSLDKAFLDAYQAMVTLGDEFDMMYNDRSYKV